MTVNRSVVTIVLILVTFVIVLVHMKDVTTLEYDNLLLANETNARHRVHTESSIGDHRQGRMSLQAELPSSKAKREQALRSILAARRRQIFSQRPISESRNLNRTPRPLDASAKDASVDVLEAQETRHGMYVTAAAGKPGDEETSGRVIDGGEATSNVDIEFVSRDEERGKRVVEQSSTGKTGNEDLSIGDKSSLSPPTTSFSSLVPNQKSSDTETRGRNTVPMPESLYNYFRPVESNIPVEDMSQFLYFGQKIQPEIQNGTGSGSNNNTAESTATAPTAANSRRRYSMKRNSTTPVPVARLEEMLNEEMNIAVERQTVEKNKVSKMKNAFRGAENGVYYRKARPAETTIASNVIGTGNGTDRSDAVAENKFRDDNPSAHVEHEPRRERGSAAAHVAGETDWNATNSTQIPSGQPVSAITRERNGAESETKLKDRPTDASNKSKPVLSSTVNGVENAKPSKVYPRKRKSNDPSSPAAYLEDEVAFSNPRESLGMDGSAKEERGIDEANYRTTVVACRESNNIETSTSREKLLGRSSTEPFRVVWTSPETSTLRIVVTEGRLGQGSADEYTVKPVVDSTEGRARGLDVLATPSTLAGPSGAEGARWKGRHREQKQQHHGRLDEGSGVLAREHERDRDPRHREEEQQHQQQHVYAYTITNVTRLLRNYTGPGLSREEQGGREASTGTTEITSGSRRQQAEAEPQPQPRSQPPPPPPLLPPPRGGGAAGIEAGRAPAELSAGTTVEPAAAGGEASAHLVGERQRKVVVAVGAHQSQQQRAVNRAQLQLTAVNKSGPRSAKTAEAYHPRGGVRWSRAKPRSTEIEGLNDRRFLRKSASAVLNQRIGAGPEGEEDGAVAGKRRRLTNGQSQKRVKGTRNVDEDSDTVKNESGSIAGDERNSRVGARVEDVTIANGSGEGTILENATTVDTTSGGTMQQRVSSAPSVETETVLDSTGGGGGGDGGSDGPLPTAVNATTTDEGGSSEQAEAVTKASAFETKDETVGRASDEESVVVPSTSTRGIGKSGADNGTENGSGSPTVTVTAASDETIVAKETTAPAPVFPVTPRMIAKAARDPIETFTSKPTEAPNQIADTKTVAGLVDPSVDTEKVYESKDRGITTMTTTASATASSSIAMTEASTTTTTATTATTTVTTSLPTVQIEISTIAQDQSATTTTDSKEPRPLEDASPSILTADLADGRRGSGERSPEVRGRNLSDKSQDASTDKDDVLPIMHLYNTSDIFNNTGPVNPFSRGTERRAEHPLPAKQPSEPSRTTEKTSDTITPRSAENWTRGPDTRKDRHEESNQVPATGPGRGSSTSNGSGNRTRHRTVYHHPILPEYNTSVYPSELNRTLFETGLISVSPRESVNISEVISKRHDGDAIASQETVAVVSYILATLVVFPIAVGVGLILRRLILRNRKVLEESDTSSEISCRKDALNLENGDFKTSIEKAITKLPRIQHLCHEAEKPPPPSSQESRWEFPRDKLRLQTVLGQGNFGQVWKAEADDLTGHQGTTRLVAVKTVKEGASDREKEDLVRELEIMQQLGSHPNVVTLLGCCTEQEPHYLILEYVMYGKLLAYLRDHRTRQDFYNFSEDSAALTSRDLTVFGYCVARGMEYLASKKIIHRDLAARNVLVDHNKLCKIADFGMSRFADGDGEVIETRHGRNALPIRWMAPESLIYSLFTTKTDVWSFGILMWEIVTLGSTPYPDMTAREVMRNVQNGYRLERPSHCRSELFRVISRCWHADPDRRPEFQTLRRDLAQLLEDNMNGHYVDLESFASECTD